MVCYQMLCSNGELVAKFETSMLFDNCEAVTLKLRPDLWEHSDLFTVDFTKYCKGRDIHYVLYQEVGKTNNVHFHGIMLFPFDKIRKNFQVWFNKYYGKYFKSEKGNSLGWHNYCAKQLRPNEGDLMDPVPFLFDPMYEA